MRLRLGIERPKFADMFLPNMTKRAGAAGALRSIVPNHCLQTRKMLTTVATTVYVSANAEALRIMSAGSGSSRWLRG